MSITAEQQSVMDWWQQVGREQDAEHVRAMAAAATFCARLPADVVKPATAYVVDAASALLQWRAHDGNVAVEVILNEGIAAAWTRSGGGRCGFGMDDPVPPALLAVLPRQ